MTNALNQILKHLCLTDESSCVVESIVVDGPSVGVDAST